jgi:acyl-CoA synthetase (NDP forming)
MPAEHVRYAHPILSGIRMAAEGMPGKPVLAVSSSSIDTSGRFREMLGERVPLLRGMRNGLVAARALAGNRLPVAGQPTRPYEPPLGVDDLRTAVAECAGPVNIGLTRRILSEYGLPLVESFLGADVTAAAGWAAGRYPVVVKAASTALPHRSDIQAVITGVSSSEELVIACGLIMERVRSARPGVIVDCFEVQEQISGQQEAAVGFAADPVFGPLVSVGTGGALVELLRDSRVGIAPVGLDEATLMIHGTRLGQLLSGYRNLLPETSVSPLADLCVRLSWLARDFQGLLSACDLNPTFVEHASGRVRIADALLVAPERPGPEDR